jgi:putative endonuclease
MYSVYIIYSLKLNRYYIGYTEDFSKRLIEHNSGKSNYTSKANDWILRYTEDFSTRLEAQHRELEIKNKKSRKYIEWLITKDS